MRQITVTIYPRDGVLNKNGQPDNSFLFTSQDTYDESRVYEFNAAMLNYSIVSSNVTSTLVLSMNAPQDASNVLRSGQPVEIQDNNDIVFQGVILSARYQLLPINENGKGGSLYANLTLAPSIYQLTSTPLIFDSTQAQQIETLLGLSLSTLQSGVTQEIDSQAFVNYMSTNTDYATFFGHVINPEDLSPNLFVMATSGQSRDSVLRSTIDFNNVVLFQGENGIINIRQLDSRIAAPFNVDLTNDFNDSEINETNPTVSLLSYDYIDNAAMTASVCSGYNMLSNDLGVGGNVTANLLSYKPNPQYFPRVDALAKTGWFVGEMLNVPINDNIVSNPTAAAAFNLYAAYPNLFMIASKQIGAKLDSIAAYQALLTGKQLAQSLAGYAVLEGLISLDDRNISIQRNMGAVIGTIMQIQNCDMEAGVIATCNRSYSAGCSYLAFNVVPLGSLTGYWRG